jgi:hypothetical protein
MDAISFEQARSRLAKDGELEVRIGLKLVGRIMPEKGGYRFDEGTGKRLISSEQFKSPEAAMDFARRELRRPRT